MLLITPRSVGKPDVVGRWSLVVGETSGAKPPCGGVVAPISRRGSWEAPGPSAVARDDKAEEAESGKSEASTRPSGPTYSDDLGRKFSNSDCCSPARKRRC